MTNPDPSSSGLLTRLSASPSGSSSSSLTSSSSFDPHAPPDDEKDASVRAGPSTLGLRELARMRKEEKRAEQEAITPRARNETTGPGAGAGAGSERRREVKLVSSVIGSGAGTGTELPFATDVQIRGWKVVGGRSWTDIGRIGAYVVYDIEITLRLGGKINILRRYSDFVNLRNGLKIRYPGFWSAIPPLPGKAHISRFNNKLLEDRQPRLQRFLRGVMFHPEMGKGGDRSLVGHWIIDTDPKQTSDQVASGGTGTDR